MEGYRKGIPCIDGVDPHRVQGDGERPLESFPASYDLLRKTWVSLYSFYLLYLFRNVSGLEWSQCHLANTNWRWRKIHSHCCGQILMMFYFRLTKKEGLFMEKPEENYSCRPRTEKRTKFRGTSLEEYKQQHTLYIILSATRDNRYIQVELRETEQ